MARDLRERFGLLSVADRVMGRLTAMELPMRDEKVCLLRAECRTRPTKSDPPEHVVDVQFDDVRMRCDMQCGVSEWASIISE